MLTPSQNVQYSLPQYQSILMSVNANRQAYSGRVQNFATNDLFEKFVKTTEGDVLQLKNKQIQLEAQLNYVQSLILNRI